MDAQSGLERVWARHLRAEPEPKQGLSTDRIVAAAIELADADGLGAVSMSRVAGRLGFTTMSLYRHVQSKDELLLLMQDVAVGPPVALDAEPGEGWRAGLVRWAWAVLTAFRLHPWIVQAIPLLGPPATPHQLAWLERGLRTLEGTGLTETEKMLTILLIDAHVISDVQFTAAGQAQAPQGSAYADVLVAMLDAERFPALVRAAQGGAFADSADPAADRDVSFTFGLDRILDGLEQLITARGAGD